jgi:hypothetical protein
LKGFCKNILHKLNTQYSGTDKLLARRGVVKYFTIEGEVKHGTFDGALGLRSSALFLLLPDPHFMEERAGFLGGVHKFNGLFVEFELLLLLSLLGGVCKVEGDGRFSLSVVPKSPNQVCFLETAE